MKKSLSLFLLVFLTAMVLFGGGTKEASDDPAAAAKGGRHEVRFWSTWTGANAEFIQSVIDTYNKSQDTYTIVMQYNGNYMDQFAKLQLTDKKNLPHFCNAATEQAGSFQYADFTRPLSDFVDKNDPDVVKLFGNLRATWGDADGNMIGYPMGNSLAGLMCNMYIMEKAGIDPYKFKSLDDVYAACQKIVAGGYAKYGIGTDHSSIYMNYSLAIEGVDVVNNGNGQTGHPTKAMYDQPPVRGLTYRYLEIWRNMTKENICYPLGSNWGNEVMPSFCSEETAMMVATAGGYGRVYRAWGEAHGADRPVDVAFIPWLAVTNNGRSTGLPASGNGWYLIDNGDEAGQRAALEFIRLFCSPDVQAKWNIRTGYFPIDKETQNHPEYQEHIKKSFARAPYAFEKQQSSAMDTFYPRTAVDTELKDAGLKALEKVVNDTNYSIDRAIDEMTKEVNEALEFWNLSNRR